MIGLAVAMLESLYVRLANTGGGSACRTGRAKQIIGRLKECTHMNQHAHYSTKFMGGGGEKEGKGKDTPSQHSNVFDWSSRYYCTVLYCTVDH